MRRHIAPILRITRTIFHKYIIRSGPHQAESLVPLDAGLAQIGTTSDILPHPVHCNKNHHQNPPNYEDRREPTFLSDLPTHCRLNAGQIF